MGGVEIFGKIGDFQAPFWGISMGLGENLAESISKGLGMGFPKMWKFFQKSHYKLQIHDLEWGPPKITKTGPGAQKIPKSKMCSVAIEGNSVLVTMVPFDFLRHENSLRCAQWSVNRFSVIISDKLIRKFGFQKSFLLRLSTLSLCVVWYRLGIFAIFLGFSMGLYPLIPNPGLQIPVPDFWDIGKLRSQRILIRDRILNNWPFLLRNST